MNQKKGSGAFIFAVFFNNSIFRRREKGSSPNKQGLAALPVKQLQMNIFDWTTDTPLESLSHHLCLSFPCGSEMCVRV